MKRVNNLYKETYKLDNIEKMIDVVCSKVKNKKRAENFLLYKAEHIINIKNRIMNKEFSFNKYNIFFITDPKCRVIMSQNIEDKVINHLFANYFLVNVFENTYTNSMCATRIGKGTKYGIDLLKRYINEIKYKNDNFYYLKIDIKKYFYNIDHEVLKQILRRKIKDKDALEVLDKIIDSTDCTYINKHVSKIKKTRIDYLIKNKCNKNSIKEVMEIPEYKFGKGCAIGNQTSQAFGLIYLNEINHYMKEKLQLKYVINYMDDFVILHSSKEYLNECLKIIRNKLFKEYKLELNENKTMINSIKNGIDFLGYRFFLKNKKLIVKLRNRTKNNFKRKVKDLQLLKRHGYITNLKFLSMMSSYKGMMIHGNCNFLYYKYMNIK